MDSLNLKLNYFFLNTAFCLVNITLSESTIHWATTGLTREHSRYEHFAHSKFETRAILSKLCVRMNLPVAEF